MELTSGQVDALTELINIGYGRAAGSLSELTGYRIALEVPQVAIHEIEALAPLLERVLRADCAAVSQAFDGPISGRALLMLDERAAAALSRLLIEDGVPGTRLDATAREVVTEVGNILLNACLGVFGNLLNVHVSFAVPQFHLESVTGVLKSVATEAAEQLRYALMIHTRFSIRTGDVNGYLVIILGVASLDTLLVELSKWEHQQAQ
ncbi:chemotaxis protein CheC [Opitutus terrae]|uniref:CheC, inhibitor of MCP methylation n=1 Tax=Opitutus terrae (strain DSM 11246 / JCM 15787 / PB90-1) TaxID=452637 RepID=B1ZY75_OPITP|nr:chemotaxis protein CheC [Opitutus terrae]ACB76221.1 CheC, inhibitor of MCP methylation [Opitutus terrae PB90-1]